MYIDHTHKPQKKRHLQRIYTILFTNFIKNQKVQ
jgi:hypothetical protein